MAKVILKNISKSFSKKEILKNINLEASDGEFVVLVGASGCGKSTLLRIIAGLETPTSGEIYIGDEKVNNYLPKQRDIAMVFQSYALYPHLNVKENIALGLKVRHVDKNEIEKRVAHAANILKLEEYLKRKPKELSGGQRQRVALARAIVRKPKVFLMDEPLSNLDAKLRSEMRGEIKKLHEQLKATFIYVTHDQTEALTMGDKIVVLNEGSIAQIGNSSDIYNNPKNSFVATFMGTNPMNIIEANIKDGFLNFADVSVNLQDKVNKDKFILGIRPEKIATQLSPNFESNPIKFKANIDFEENLGSYKNIYFTLGERKFCAVADSSIEASKTMNFSINPEDLYFFEN